MDAAIWKPSHNRIINSNMNQFLNRVKANLNLPIENYLGLYNWSIENTEKFWIEIWEQSKIINSQSFDRVLGEYPESEFHIPRPSWFEGAKLNFAENLLKRRDESIALVSYSEKSKRKEISYKDLYLHVAKVARSLKNLGVKKGDRVAGFISNTPEAVIGMLATTAIGAIWSSCSPDFGFNGVMDRFGQIMPKVLFAVNGYTYNGKDYSTIENVSHIANEIESIQKVIIIKQIDKETISNTKFVTWEKFTNNSETEIKFTQVDFDHPVYIMFSSGTTGIPKCIIHAVGGTLVQHWKELYLHTDLSPEKSIMYFTTCGWMMWNWLVSSLMIGSKVVLFDGSPAFPNFDVFWQIVDDEKLNILGTSPKYLSALQKSGSKPKNNFRLENLETILSTGSPLTTENYNYVYQQIKNDVMLSSISGGTDIIGCFALGNPMQAVYYEELQTIGLGMKVQAWDENKKSLINQEGELVCLNPFPSMPVGFWEDNNNHKYYNAYFNYYEGIWRHGDFVIVTERNGLKVLGRSDATLNPGGIRIGTAEIYRILDSMSEIKDSVVVGQKWKYDIRILLFVVLTDDSTLDDTLKNKILSRIKSEATPRHAPKFIRQISQVPVTISGKKVELAIKKILEGEEVKNKSALANPESLNQFYEMKDLMAV